MVLILIMQSPHHQLRRIKRLSLLLERLLDLVPPRMELLSLHLQLLLHLLHIPELPMERTHLLFQTVDLFFFLLDNHLLLEAPLV